jgi:hypothetical protein
VPTRSSPSPSTELPRPDTGREICAASPSTYDADNSTRPPAYRRRFELFFHSLEHGLRIPTFLGASDHAVRRELWTSICVCLAMTTVRKQQSVAGRTPRAVWRCDNVRTDVWVASGT